MGQRRTLVLHPFRTSIAQALTIVGAVACTVLGGIALHVGFDLGLVILSPIAVGLLIGGATLQIVRVCLVNDPQREQLLVAGPHLFRPASRIFDVADVEDAAIEDVEVSNGTIYRLVLVIAGAHVPLTTSFVQQRPDENLAKLKAFLRDV